MWRVHFDTHDEVWWCLQTASDLWTVVVLVVPMWCVYVCVPLCDCGYVLDRHTLDLLLACMIDLWLSSFDGAMCTDGDCMQGTARR
jgi:hypothetical protein